MDLLLDYLPLLPNVDMETKSKWRSVQVLCTYVSLFGSEQHNVHNCNQIIVVLPSPNCMNENFLEMYPHVYGMKLDYNLYFI